MSHHLWQKFKDKDNQSTGEKIEAAGDMWPKNKWLKKASLAELANCSPCDRKLKQ